MQTGSRSRLGAGTESKKKEKKAASRTRLQASDYGPTPPSTKKAPLPPNSRLRTERKERTGQGSSRLSNGARETPGAGQQEDEQSCLLLSLQPKVIAASSRGPHTSREQLPEREELGALEAGQPAATTEVGLQEDDGEVVLDKQPRDALRP